MTDSPLDDPKLEAAAQILDALSPPGQGYIFHARRTISLKGELSLALLAEAFRQAEALTGIRAALAKYETADSIGILPEYWHQLKKEAHAALAAWNEIAGEE